MSTTHRTARHNTFVIALFFLLFGRLSAQSADQLIRTAWDHLQNGNAPAAEHSFKAVLERDAHNSRARIGLCYLYSWQHRYTEAWDQCKDAIDHYPNPPALFYSVMSSTLSQANSSHANFRLKETYEYMIAHPDSLGIIKAMSYSRLADAYRFTNNIEKSKEYYNQLHAIDTWAMIGPFENISGSGYNKEYEPERAVDFKGHYPGRFGTTTEWFVPQHLRPDKWVDIERHFTTAAGVFYAYCSVYSPKKQRVSVRVGTSGAFKLFLNDELTLACEDEFNNDLDTYLCTTELQSGWNKVLMKMCAWDINRNNFMLRIVDDQGNALPEMQVSTEQKSYGSRPGALITKMRQPFELFFEEQLKAHPDDLENYLILADCYLRNDQGEKGELTLRDALRRAPKCVLLLDRMMEAYSRNDKRDMVVATLEKLWSIDSTDLNALEYKFNEAINNKNNEEAERLCAVYAKVCPEEEKVIGAKLYLYSVTGKDAEAVDLLKSGYNKFPTNYALASGMAVMLKQNKHDYEGAIDLWKRYAKDEYSYDALSNIADLYAQTNDISNWEKYRAKMDELSNDAPGYHYTTAMAYFRQEAYDQAEKQIRISLEACPNSADYHEVLGDICLQRKQKDEAIQHYKKALYYVPGYMKLREKIRELEGKKQVFSQFPRYNVDSLMKKSPNADAYPEDESVVVLDDAKYVIYPEGTAEGHFELLVRILKQEGIDEWKELDLGNSATIEKAVSIKAAGSELRADVSKGQMVFKGLQEGDFIYVRYRDYQRGSDRFFKHYMDRRFFNGKYATRVSRLAVLAPSELDLRYHSVNIQIEPKKTKLDDGTLYEWVVENQPSIKNEASMPHVDAISKYVELSTIDSWKYIADWYCDVTNLKSKVTYEIREKMEDLVPTMKNMSDEEVVRRVYQFITDSIRYSYVPFRQSGGTPQRARDVLLTKIGDCKDVATLGISMLSVAGIQADYCLVLTNSALMPDELPSQEFDHVILRVYLKSGMRYLDLTAANFPIGALPGADIDAFSLLIRRDTKQAQRISRSALNASSYSSVCSATTNDAGDLVMQRTSDYTAMLSGLIRYAFRNKGRKENEKLVTEDMSRLFPNVKLKTLRFTGLDSLTPSVRVVEQMEAPKYISDVGTYKLLRLPWFRKLSMEEEFSYDTREYPIEVGHSIDTTDEEFRLEVPGNLAPIDLPKDVRLQSLLGDYEVHYSFENHVFRARRTFVYRANRIDPKDYVAVREVVNSIAKEDEKQILFGEQAPKGKAKKK